MSIIVKDLVKEYKNGYRALKSVTLTIDNGMFGLLGPNGAGKTTFMKILVTLLEPSSGAVSMNDYDLLKDRNKIRQITGYLPQSFSSFSRLTVWEYLEYTAILSGLKIKKERIGKVTDMLETVRLYEVRDRRASKLSGGMKRRLGIAQALIGEPKILIIDEPTTGLDPEERLKFRNLMSEMSGKNDMIIILSTHIVGDISSSCGQMAMLDEGSLVFNDTPETLINQAKGNVWRVKATDLQLTDLKAKYPVVSTIRNESCWDVELIAENISGFDKEMVEPDLEHAYMYFMNKLGKSVI